MNSKLERLAPVWQPHPGQREFLENPSRLKVLACGRRWGKTDACAAQIAASFFEASPTRHVILAPTQDQANLLFERALTLLEGLLPSANLKPKRSPYPTLSFGPHRLTARSGHLARALRGNEATHLIVDEASYLPESLITEVAMPMLATTDGVMTLIGTPNGKNHFWRFFCMGQAGDHGVWSRTGPSGESPFVSKSFLAVQRELISDRAYRVEYEAEFVDSAGQFFGTEVVEACVVEHLPARSGQVYIGIDWAKERDATAVAVVQGDAYGASLLHLETVCRATWGEIYRRVADVVAAHRDPIVLCDGTGLGAPATAHLRDVLEEGRLEPVVFTNESKLKMAFDLLALFEHKRIAMRSHPDLLRELQYYESTETEHGNTRLGAPRGLHDDLVTALMLATSRLRRVTPVPLILGADRQSVLHRS